jgi:ankyrin repeat protein
MNKLIKILEGSPELDRNPELRDSENYDFYKDYDLNGAKDIIQSRSFNPAEQNNKAIISASSHGRLEIVKLLLKDPRVDPSAKKNKAIERASYHGNIEIVKLLLKDNRVDPSDQKNKAFINAVEFGHYKVASLLIRSDRRVNPHDQNNKAWFDAITIYCSEQTMKFLLSLPRFVPSSELLEKSLKIARTKDRCKGVVELIEKIKLVDLACNTNKALCGLRSDIMKYI